MPFTRSRFHPRLMAVLFLTLLVVGCGGKQTYPVEGVVIFVEGGMPARELAGGTVLFEGVNGSGSAEGTIDQDGRFKLLTRKPGDGAVAGKHRVAVLPPDTPDIDHRVRASMDPSFSYYETSGIVIEVLPQENQVTIKVARAKK